MGAALWRAMRSHRGWTGLAAGLVIGVLGALALTHLIASVPRPAGLEPGELVILSGADESAGGQRDELIRKWNAIGDGRPAARIEVVAGDTNQQRAEMVARAQGTGPPVDIYNLDVIDMEEFQNFGYILPLDPGLVTHIDGFLDRPMETCLSPDGTLWCLPFNTDAALLYYRTDITGGPVAFTSLQALAASIRSALDPAADAPDGVIAGYAGQLSDYEGGTVNAIEAIWAFGGDVVDRNGEVVIDSPEARAGLAWLVENLSPGNPQVILPDSLEFGEAETANAFAEGKTIFMRNWPVWYNNLAARRDAAGDPALQFDVTPLPGRSVLGGQNLAVAARTDQPRAAQELIDFLTSPLSQQILFERGGFAATRAIVYDDVEVRRRYPYAEQLRRAINLAQPRPSSAYYALFSQVFIEGIRYALEHDGDLPPGFVERLADARQGILS